MGAQDAQATAGRPRVNGDELSDRFGLMERLLAEGGHDEEDTTRVIGLLAR